MDIQKFLQKYNEEIRYAEYDNGYEIAFPFKFYNDCQTSSVFISEDETGLFTITDNGNTMRYFENMGIDPQKYADKIKIICDMFDLTFENGIFKGILGEYETNQTFTHLTNFLIGISHVATVYRF
ncbi:MAG: DUF1828 domain-containing protein [Clostridia bacterium]|nr:DUF1828 domain-containing protein [Clostridia bacterium]